MVFEKLKFFSNKKLQDNPHPDLKNRIRKIVTLFSTFLIVACGNGDINKNKKKKNR